MNYSQNNWAQAIYVACALAVLIPHITLAQPDTLWTRDVQDERGQSLGETPLQVIRTSDGGFAVGTAGLSGRYERLGTEFAVVKLDSIGQTEWTRYLSGYDTVEHCVRSGAGKTIAEVYDGGFVIGGHSIRAAVARVGPEGDSLWFRHYTPEEFAEVGGMECCIAPDSNVVLASRNNIVKLSIENGDTVWRTLLEDRFTAKRIELSGDSGFIAVGYAGFFDNIYVIRIEQDGEIIWEREYEADESESCGCITPSSAGGWCLAGSQCFGEDTYDTYPKLLWIDENGEIIWQRIIDDFGRGDGATDIVETPDGGYAFTGGGLRYYTLYHVDFHGEPYYQVEYGRWDMNHITGTAYSILLMEDGGYLLGGFGDNLGCWLVCTEPDPVDIPFELEAGEDMHSYRDVPIDSVSAWELELRNVGWRYVVIDSLWFEGDASAFACPLDLPFRMEPEDTSFVPVFFQPPTDSFYNATLILPYGNDRTLDIELWGRGVFNSVSDDFILHPSAFSLSATPNPFNSTTSIVYTLPTSEMVTVKIFNLSGREVSILYEGMSDPGIHIYTWDASGLPSGLYVCRMETDAKVASIKLAMIR